MSTAVWIVLLVVAVLLASFVFSIAVGKWLARLERRDNDDFEDWL